MKLLKSIAIIAMLFASISAMAQQIEKTEKSPEEKAKRYLKAINKECSLSTEQNVKVEQILLDTQNRLTTLKASKTSQKGEKLKSIKEINDNQTTAMKKVLNPEQFIKYQALVEKQKEKIRNKMIEKRGESTNEVE
jgi:hypothetical protein